MPATECIRKLLKLSENDEDTAIDTIDCISNLLVICKNNGRVADFMKIAEKHGILIAIDNFKDTENKSLKEYYRVYKETLYETLESVVGNLYAGVDRQWEDLEFITVKLKSYFDKSVVSYKIRKGVPIGELMVRYCDRKNFRKDLTVFRYEYRKIEETDTPISLGMEDGHAITTDRVGKTRTRITEFMGEPCFQFDDGTYA